MKKFSYSMQNILNLQYKLEEQEKAAFQSAVHKLEVEEEILKEYLSQKDDYEQKLKEEEQGIIDLKMIRFYRNSIDVMKSRIRSQMFRVHLEEKNVETARIKLQQEMKKRKTHEIMKEKAFENYKYELSQEESKEIDELVSYRHTINE